MPGPSAGSRPSSAGFPDSKGDDAVLSRSLDTEACPVCGAPLLRGTGAGRRRRYCGTACRSKAQRLRQAGGRAQEPVAQGPLGRQLAGEVQRLGQQLLDGELAGEDLATLLDRASAVRKEVDLYVAAAVQDARHRGEKWEEIAKAAHIAPDTARTRWREDRVCRMLELHANDKGAAPVRLRPAGLAGEPEGDPAGTEDGGDGGDTAAQARQSRSTASLGRLASALSALHTASGLSIREVADSTRLSPSYISRILSGDRYPTWDLVCALALLFHGDPAELRVLFEAAHGLTAPPRQSARQGIARLHAALRGLHLAARSPGPREIARRSGNTVSASMAQHTLDGLDIPEWEVLAALVRALGGRPADIKPLWESVHYVFLMCDDPREGTPDAPTARLPAQRGAADGPSYGRSV